MHGIHTTAVLGKALFWGRQMLRISVKVILPLHKGIFLISNNLFPLVGVVNASNLLLLILGALLLTKGKKVSEKAFLSGS